MNDTTLQVSGMSCGGCLGRVTKALRELGAVHDVEADLRSGKVRIDHSPAVTAAQLADRISAIGYPSRTIAAA